MIPIDQAPGKTYKLVIYYKDEQLYLQIIGNFGAHFEALRKDDSRSPLAWFVTNSDDISRYLTTYRPLAERGAFRMKVLRAICLFDTWSVGSTNGGPASPEEIDELYAALGSDFMSECPYNSSIIPEGLPAIRTLLPQLEWCTPNTITPKKKTKIPAVGFEAHRGDWATPFDSDAAWKAVVDMSQARK